MSWSANESGSLSSAVDQLPLAVEDAGATGEDAVVEPALDAGDLQDGAAVGREVAAQQAQPAGVLERLGDGVGHVAIGPRRIEPADLLGERLAGAGDRIAVEQAGVEQLLDDHLQTALRVDVDHRVEAERAQLTSTGSRRESSLNSLWLITSSQRSNPAARAISTLWSTTFVEPPIAIGDGQRVAQRRRRDDVARADTGAWSSPGGSRRAPGNSSRRRASSDAGATMCSGSMPSTAMNVCMVL